MKIILTLSVLAALLAAGCTSSDSAVLKTPSASSASDAITAQSVSGGSGGTGGNVRDVLATFVSFTADKSTGDNSGSTVVTFSGTARDGNGKEDIKTVSVSGAGPSALGATHTVTQAERDATTEPASFGADGYKVWGGAGGRDGKLLYKYKLTITAFTTSGSYSFSSSVANPTGTTSTTTAGQAIAFSITKFSQIDVGSAPVDLSGAAAGSSWGAWSANPGDSNLASANFLKLVNNGDVAGAQVVVDFSQSAFSGADANYTIPIDGNVQFAFCDVASAAVAPSTCTFTYGATSGSGSTTVTFAGKSHAIYVTYRIVSLPDVLAPQNYGATFTVTEL